MDKNKLESVIDALIISTESGETIWNRKNSIFDSELRKTLTTKIDEITIDVNIECDESGNIIANGIMLLNSKDITGGIKAISNTKIKVLQENLHLIHKGLVGPDKTDMILDNILSKIGKVGIRDNKIEKLLNKRDSEIKTPLNENESKSIFNRIFKL
jgi:hypothetical protein